MSDVNSYRDLKVWQAGMEIAVSCYDLTRDFPKSETYGMVNQIRRASVSIPANIAEGYGRDSTGNFVSFLRTSQGSLKELETHVLVCIRVGLLDEKIASPLMQQCDELGRMLRAYIRSIQRSVEEQ